MGSIISYLNDYRKHHPLQSPSDESKGGFSELELQEIGKMVRSNWLLLSSTPPDIHVKVASVVEELIEVQRTWEAALKSVEERHQRAGVILGEFSQLYGQITLAVSLAQGLGPIYG